MGTDRTRVVVTGLGAITPVGADVPSTWEALKAGRSGVQQLTDDWAAELPARIAGWAAADPRWCCRSRCLLAASWFC